MSAYELWHVEVAYTVGVWTDVTPDVDSMTAPVYATNGTTAEVTGDPGSMSLALHNPGFKYTPGNTLSAFALSTGLGIRFFERIAGNPIYHFTGFVEFPEIDSVNLSMLQDQTIQVSAVDQLSLWERSETFVSTLGAHIMGAAPESLVGYWPLNDLRDPFAPAVGSTPATVYTPGATLPPGDQAPEVNFQSGGSPPGDDANCVEIVYGYNGTTDVAAPSAYANLLVGAGNGLGVALTAGQVLTLVYWLNMTTTTNVTADGATVNVTTNNGGNIFGLTRTADALGTHWKARYFNGSFYNVEAANGAANGTLRWYAVAIRWGFTPNVIELWVDDVQYTGTFVEAVTTTYVPAVQVGTYGSVAHAQLYMGDPNDFTFADFTAQRAVGLTGFERQTTGDRIRTLARYAGKTDADLVEVDTGQSIMSAARLAGLTVAGAMYEARDTEQGDLYIDGTGLTTFADRRTLLNI